MRTPDHFDVVSLVLWTALLVSVASVELGVRTSDHGASLSQLPLPDVMRPAVERLRALPFETVAQPRAAAIVSGVVFGRTEHVDAAAEEAFLTSGLWHLLAASGQNIALVAVSCVLLARLVRLPRTAGAILALATIPAYVMVVGGGASIVRAGIMGELLLVAWLVGQHADVRRVLLLAAVCICWAWPGSYRLLGFQLSFACVLVLLRFAGPIQHSLQEAGVPRVLAGAVAATMTCSVATAPLLLLRTGSAPLAGACANVLAVPLAGALLLVGLAGSMIELVAPVLPGELLLRLAGILGAALLLIAERAAALPLAQTSSPAIAVGMPLAVLATALASPARRRATALVCAVVTTMLLLVSSIAPTVVEMPALGMRHRVPSPPAGVLRIASLDIGQGDATLLMLDGHALLVDTGPPGGGVVARAREAGAAQIDAVLLTHDSLDHRGGLDAAVAGLRPSRIIIPRNALGEWGRVRRLGMPVEETCAGDRLQLADATITVLNPPCDDRVTNLTGDQHNDNAIVLLVEHDEMRTLLMSDAESPAVIPLRPGEVDVLRVAHHGSRDERLPELLGELRPDVAMISVGARNTYGHPNRTTLDQLAASGTRVLRTDEHGSIVLDAADQSAVLR